jgi:anti-sigma B factor antagonist
MSDAGSKATFLVDPNSDPVIVRVEGRASLHNSDALRDFFRETIARGHGRFVVDLQRCQSMDSTFLGVLAGAALGLRKRNPPGSLVLANLGSRNLELVRNLGLHRILTVDAGDAQLQYDGNDRPLAPTERSNLERARITLEAHEHLIEVDESNRGQFQDVLGYLRDRVKRHGG